MKKSPVFKKDTNVVTRAIDDEVLLLPVYKDSDEGNAIYSLNDSAAAAWNLIDGKRSVAEIVGRLSRSFKSDESVIAKRADVLFRELLEIKVIRAAGPKR